MINHIIKKTIGSFNQRIEECKGKLRDFENNIIETKMEIEEIKQAIDKLCG